MKTNRESRPSPRAVERIMKTMARGIAGMELPGRREDLRGSGRGSVSDSDRDAAVRPYSGRDDACRVHPVVQASAHAARARQAPGPGDRAADLSRRLLSEQGAAREGVLRDARAPTSAGRVPSTMEELVRLPGVGRKTANLVLILGFKSLRNICVDIHVHRISNRLGWVRTDRSRGDGAGVVPGGPGALVAADQSVSGDVGSERLPACVSSLRGLRDRWRLSKDWTIRCV